MPSNSHSTPNQGITFCTPKQEFTVFNLNLSIFDLDGELSPDKKLTPGAYIHCNIDNDNGSVIPDTGMPIPDKDITDYIANENDLKKLVINLEPIPKIGLVSLRTRSGSLLVWKSINKGADNKIIGYDYREKLWDLSDSLQRTDFINTKDNLWVEGNSNYNTKIQLSVTYKDSEGKFSYSDVAYYNLIAATCGRQPKPDERIVAKNAWPKLENCEWSITGEATTLYNCIAWSVGETNVWYNDIYSNFSDPNHPIVGIDMAYGNKNGILEISDMDAFYDVKGYLPTATSFADADVVYYSGFHASKKKNCNCGMGKWAIFESKCGEWFKIEHLWDQLNDGDYGNPICYYKFK